MALTLSEKIEYEMLIQAVELGPKEALERYNMTQEAILDRLNKLTYRILRDEMDQSNGHNKTLY